MTAQTLRAAAKVLRERAERATPGDRWVRNHFIPNSGSLHIERSRYVFSIIGGSDADRDYIATMHPGVGLAVADVLDALATDVETLESAEGRTLNDSTLDMNLSAYPECIALARAILGGDA